MSYRNGNYTAFYVDEPYYDNLGANTAYDLRCYRLIQAWKANTPSFPFVDSHGKTYNVRDESAWESTLKPRLHTRLNESKNIILILSSHTRPSQALNEEMEFGIGELGLPVIVTYPEFNPVNLFGVIDDSARRLWSSLPAFKRNMSLVPTLHIPFTKEALSMALNDPDMMVQTKVRPGEYMLSR